MRDAWPGLIQSGRLRSGFTIQFKRRQQEHIFPASFIYPIREVAMKWHYKSVSDIKIQFFAPYLRQMKKIGIISDTHGYLDPKVAGYFADCDEIWHAGDFGTVAIAEELEKTAPLKGVYGNIDGTDVRSVYPETLVFSCESVKVLMIHIGGHPARYAPGVKALLQQHKPDLMICGHSHILKVMYDEKCGCLHINPGAAGKQGWHQMRTLIRLTVDGNNMKDLEVIELGKR